MFSFSKSKINVGDLVGMIGQIDQPSIAIGCKYIDQLSPLQISNLYRVTHVDGDIYSIEPTQHKDRRSLDIHFDNLILVKNERPKPKALDTRM